MAEPIISVSGLRGIIGETLSPEVAARYACAWAASAAPGSVILSRDGRASGRMLADAVRSALQAVGRSVVDVDVAATPTTGVLVREHHAGGGIQVSASHNPAEYNGLKLFNERGQVISAKAGQQVVERYRRGSIEWVSYDRLGQVLPAGDPLAAHVHLVLATVDVERIRAARFQVLLDSNHGAGGALGARLLAALGCRVTLVGGEPDGQFAHLPEPTAENLASVLAQVRAAQADVGFCQDPDADRLAVIDEQGCYIGEECTLALCVEQVLAHQRGPIVTNCSTSRMTEDLADRAGVPCFRSAVGEANVVARMQADGALFGGEGNGGPIDPRVGYVRDSFVGMARILSLMAERKLKVSALAAALPRYEIVKTKITLAPERVAPGLAALQKHFADAQADRLDGLRLDWPGRWLLVRASNTEPIVRAIAEAPTQAEAAKLCADAAQVLSR